MLITWSPTKFEIGEIVNAIRDADNNLHHQPTLIIGFSTYEEFEKQYIETKGYLPDNYKTIRTMYFYKVSID